MSAANVSGVTFSGNGYYNPSGNLNFGSTLSSGWSYDPISVTLAGTGAPRYGAGNFEFTFAAVPESSTFAVAGVGMLGLVYFGRGISRRAKAK